jgi:hypothetical protein
MAANGYENGLGIQTVLYDSRWQLRIYDRGGARGVGSRQRPLPRGYLCATISTPPFGKPTSPHRYSFRWGLVFAIGSIETNAVKCDATYSPYAGHRLVTGNADWHYLGIIHTALYGVAVVALGTLIIICHNLIASSTSK